MPLQTFNFLEKIAVDSLATPLPVEGIRGRMQNFIEARLPLWIKVDAAKPVITAMYRGWTDYRQHLLLVFEGDEDQKEYRKSIAEFFQLELEQYLRESSNDF